MPSRPRSRKSSRSSTRNSFKSASILENGGQAPLQDEPNAVVQDDIELVPRNSQSIPDTGASAPAAPSGGAPPTDHMESRDEPISTGTRIDPTASGQRDRLPHKRFGLHTDQLRGQHPQGGPPMDYKQKYPEDPIYKETEENARVFHVYNDESEIFDNDMVIEAGDNLDILLVFAGLFASVLTTFVVQTSQSLSPDKTDISNALLREMISLQRAQENRTYFSSIPAADTSFAASRTDIWVNGLWFISLALSLSTALLAVIAKQWLRQYSSFISGTARERALIRQFRYDGFEKWGVRLIIGLLPMILHVSLFLFLSGLVVFLLPLNNIVACVIAGIAGFLCGAYVITNTLPVIFIQCPYRTPLSEILNTLCGVVKIIPVISLLFVMRPWWESLILMENLGVVRRKEDWMSSRALYILARRFDRWSTPLKDVERACTNGKDKWGHPLGITGALSWLGQTTSDISAKAVVVEAIGSVYHPSLVFSSTHPSIHKALEQQWKFSLPHIQAGDLLQAADERIVERIMRGVSMILSPAFYILHGRAASIHCHTYTMLLMTAVHDCPSRLYMEDEEPQDLSPAQVFSFVAGRKDLSVELEAPSWIWWSVFTRAVGSMDTIDDEESVTDICTNGSPPRIDSDREDWLKQVNIPTTLRCTVWERMLDVYRDGDRNIFKEVNKPYTLLRFSELFATRRLYFELSPPSPLSTVSLATFLFDNFAQFTDFWMETGDVHSHIQSSVTTDTPL